MDEVPGGVPSGILDITRREDQRQWTRSLEEYPVGFEKELTELINVDGRGLWRSTQWDLKLASKGRTKVLANDEVEIERTVFRAV